MQEIIEKGEVEQPMLFDIREPWEVEWVGMPEFSQQDLTSWKSVIVHFESPGDLAAFAKLIQQPLTPKTRSIWYPPAEIGHMMNKRFQDEDSIS